MGIENFVKKRRYLFWSVKDVGQLSDSVIVESVLQYGDFDDVRKLIAILGRDQVARIFRRHLRQRRVNYDPRIAHYFTLFFRQHAKT
ncbi:MAG: hypothetical protein HY984_02480 [Candidatus Magasanikbacteria bacterium]|nr:hypothetical protein [Candidatus Magasanikbacteria bacterium]